MVRTLVSRALAALAAVPLIAALIVVGPSPASAAVADHWGYAVINNPAPPAAGVPTDPLRSYGSWKAAFPMSDPWVFPDFQPGLYRVLFPHIASTRGFAHVTAVGSDARWCQVMSQFPSGADQIVRVQCYKHGGIPDNTRFSVVYSTSSAPPVPGGAHAYVKANSLGGFAYSFNSFAAPNSVVRFGVGQYRVTLNAVGTGVPDGNVQITAEQPNLPPRRCKLANWFAGGTTHDLIVYCFNQANALSDSWFYLSYHRQRPVIGQIAAPKHFAYLFHGGPATADFNSQGGVNTVVSSGVGQYLVTFPKVAVKTSTVHAGAFGVTPDYCNLQELWGFSGTDVLVRNVICFNGAGAQAPNRFLVTYTSNE